MAPVDVAPEVARVLDLEGTLENLGGDPELLKELLDYFLELAPGQLDELGAAVEAGDTAAVDLQAHAMKGGAANVGAVRVSATARELEMLAKGGGLAGAAAIFARLRAEFAALQQALPGLDWTKLT